MNLRGKTTLILAATIVVASAIIGLGSRWYFQIRLEGVERAMAEETLDRAAALVYDDLDQLDMVAHDWATWNDSWDYVAEPSRAFEESNLSPSAIEPLDLSCIAYIDSRGGVVYVYPKSPPSLVAIARRYGASIPDEKGRRGVEEAGGVLQLVAARAIERSDRSGSGRGVLVMMRAITAARVARYSRISGMPVSLALGRGDGGEGLSLSYSGSSLRASMSLEGAFGASAADVMVDLPRIAQRYRRESAAFFIAAFALIIAALGMVAIHVFEVAVLRRMRALGTQLESIARTGGKGRFVRTTGRDELTELERSMNATLSALYRVIDERDIAMREIHHRVKNTLQVISSLISLQICMNKREEEKALLRDTGRRVSAMAFVQEELFAEQGFERIDCDRLFRRIADAAREENASGKVIGLGIETGGISVGLSEATPLGLIVCEVLANAYRHAFAKGGGGSIRLSMRRERQGEARLEIADDGSGIEAGAERGLGLEIIEALVKQLRGSYRYSRREEGGTLFSLELPPDPGSPD